MDKVEVNCFELYIIISSTTVNCLEEGVTIIVM